MYDTVYHQPTQSIFIGYTTHCVGWYQNVPYITILLVPFPRCLFYNQT